MGWLIFGIYMLIGAFWGRIYYNRSMKYMDGREEVLAVIVAFVWPVWVAYHILRLSTLIMFKLADYACGKGRVSHGLGGGR